MMPITPEDIIGEVATITGVPAPALTSKRRGTKRVSLARFLTIAAIRTAFPAWTLEATADALNRTHGCIGNARKQHVKLLKVDREYKSQAMEIVSHLFTFPSR